MSCGGPDFATAAGVVLASSVATAAEGHRGGERNPAGGTETASHRLSFLARWAEITVIPQSPKKFRNSYHYPHQKVKPRTDKSDEMSPCLPVTFRNMLQLYHVRDYATS